MRTLGFLAILYGLVAFFSVVFAQNINSYQPLQPGSTSNYVSRFGEGEDCTDAVACFLMDEASGNIVDEIASVTAVPFGGESYEQDGGAWGLGISVGNAEGFRKSGSTASLEPGLSDFSILVAERVDTPGGEVNWITYATTIVGTATTGMEFRWNFPAITKRRQLYLRATDGSDLTLQNDDTEITAAYNDGQIHYYEVVVDRDGLAQFKLDGTVEFSQSAATLDGKSIGSTGLGIGQDYRGAWRNAPSTYYFVRQK